MSNNKPGPDPMFEKQVTFTVRVEGDLNEWLERYAAHLTRTLGVPVSKAAAFRKILEEKRSSIPDPS